VHVLFLVEDFPDAAKAAGGVRVSLRKLAHEQAQHGKVSVVALERVFPPLRRYAKARRRAAAAAGESPASARAASADAAPNLTIHRYRYLHIPVLWPLAEPLQLALYALWVALRHGHGVDVVHGHRAFPMGLPTLVAARVLGRQPVLTVYGSDVHTHAVAGSCMLRFWTRYVLHRTHRIIAVSRSLMEALRRLGVAEDRCTYIPSGVDAERFRPRADRAAVRAALGLPDAAHIFLAINLFVPVKGHRILVEAFADLAERRPDVFLVMTSDGRLRPQIEEQVAAAGLSDRVRFTGFLDYGDMPRWVAAADVLVLPSLNEGMPLSILEGFASGKPLVGTNVGGIPELVTDDRFGLLVPPGDAAALARAMEAAVNRPWDVEALRAHALEFGWPSVAARVREAYRS
jgi:glycosyltransferase involved in cell wall biosynthesis